MPDSRRCPDHGDLVGEVSEVKTILKTHTNGKLDKIAANQEKLFDRLRENDTRLAVLENDARGRLKALEDADRERKKTVRAIVAAVVIHVLAFLGKWFLGGK